MLRKTYLPNEHQKFSGHYLYLNLSLNLNLPAPKLLTTNMEIPALLGHIPSDTRLIDHMTIILPTKLPPPIP